MNEDGHIAERRATRIEGGRGYCIYVVPSLDMVIYKMGGTEAVRSETHASAGCHQYDGSRDNWKPAVRL
jgi:hypothetical protein